MALKFHTKLTIMTYTCKIFNIIVNKLVNYNLHTQLYKTQTHIQPPQWLIINCPYRIICYNMPLNLQFTDLPPC